MSEKKSMYIEFEYVKQSTYIEFEYIKQSTYIEFEYVKQSTYIEFEYVKQSTYIEFEYVFRVIFFSSFASFFYVLFLVRHAYEWPSTCSNSIERKETDDFNFTLH